jgi:hypothetical protein
MSKAAALRRRIDAIEKATESSFAAPFRTLTESDRAQYRQWREISEEWHDKYAPDDAYAAVLDGHGPLPLPRSLHDKLFGAAPVISQDMTESDAANAYLLFAHSTHR